MNFDFSFEPEVFRGWSLWHFKNNPLINPVKIEVRTNIKFIEKNLVRRLRKLLVPWKKLMDKKSVIYKWITHSKERQHHFVRKNRCCSSFEGSQRLIAEIIANAQDISVDSAYASLSEKLKLRKLSARWAAKLLHSDQLSIKILNKWDQNPEGLLRRIVTGNETSLYHPEDRDQLKAMVTQLWKWFSQSKCKPVGRKIYLATALIDVCIFPVY